MMEHPKIATIEQEYIQAYPSFERITLSPSATGAGIHLRCHRPDLAGPTQDAETSPEGLTDRQRPKTPPPRRKANGKPLLRTPSRRNIYDPGSVVLAPTKRHAVPQDMRRIGNGRRPLRRGECSEASITQLIVERRIARHKLLREKREGKGDKMSTEQDVEATLSHLDTGVATLSTNSPTLSPQIDQLLEFEEEKPRPRCLRTYRKNGVWVTEDADLY